MSYGLVITNSSGELAITDQTTNYHYAGSANPYQVLSSALFTKAWYQITAPAKPIIFVEPSGTDRFVIVAVTNMGGTTWRVFVAYTGTAPRIHGFSAITNTTPLGDSGIAIYKSDGTLAFDSTRNPMSLTHSTVHTPSLSPGTYSGTPSELNAKEITLLDLPTRAAFFYQTAGATTMAYNTTYSGYAQFFNLLYRNGTKFGNVWRQATVGYVQSPTAMFKFDDPSTKPLYVIDAARYD